MKTGLSSDFKVNRNSVKEKNGINSIKETQEDVRDKPEHTHTRSSVSDANGAVSLSPKKSASIAKIKNKVGRLPSIIDVKSLKKIGKEKIKSLSEEDFTEKSKRKTLFSQFFNLEDIAELKKQNKFYELEQLDSKVNDDNMIIRLYDYDSINHNLENFCFKGGKNAYFNINNFDSQFNRTNYASKSSHNVFYQKYNVHRELTRKKVIKKETPSFAYIP